jgi:hypothetical protein
VRIIRHGIIAALTVAAFSSIVTIRETTAQETVTITEGDATGAGCGCKGVQQPPWHASVRGPACGPVCGPQHGRMFHADPCGQLCVRRQLHQTGATMPSIFPRLHTWCAEGHMPTPRPIAVPRCHECGAVIEGGF